MFEERVELAGADGQRLVGRLVHASGPVRGTALFAHCFTCGKDLRAARRVSAALARRGWTVLRFDFTGLGESEGDHALTSVTTQVEDLVAAASWLRTHHVAPTLLVGHSLGGSASILAARELAEVRAVATLGAPANTAHLRSTLGPLVHTVEAAGTAEVTLAGRRLRLGRALLESLDGHAVEDALPTLRPALLVLHGPDDEVVPFEHALRLVRAAPTGASLLTLAGADHLLSQVTHADRAGELVASWAEAWAEAPEPALPLQPPHTVLARGDRAGLRTRIVLGNHRLVADEPVDQGGRDQGPAPYDLLLASLGACTAMTLRLYADRKQLPLEAVEVELTHAKEVRTTDGVSRPVDRIRRVIRLGGPLAPEHRERLLDIAGKCPVHRTLHGGAIEVDTTLAAAVVGQAGPQG